MSTGYRDTLLTCPICDERLDPKEVGDAVIDVCSGCGGIWVDWFDGELVTMIKGAPSARGVRNPERAGSSACPRCLLPLDAESYLGSRAEILRCADCAGAFVPRASVNALAVFNPEGEDSSRPRDPLTRLRDVLQRWLRWKRPGDR